MNYTGVSAINDKVKQESSFVISLKHEIEKVIIGQKYLIDFALCFPREVPRRA